MTGYRQPDRQAAIAFAKGYPADMPVVMLNLLRYREQAAYEHGAADAVPCSGRDAYARYMEKVAPLLEGAGGQVIWSGSSDWSLVGPADEHWDTVLLVRYPSKDAFLAMANSPAYMAITHHRSAALADSRLVPMTQDFTRLPV